MTTLPFSTIGLNGFSFGNCDHGDIEIILGDELIGAVSQMMRDDYHIGALMRILRAQVTGRGFSITLESQGQEFKITDPMENKTLYNFWKPIVPDLLEQMICYGMVVVDHAHRPGFEPPYDTQPRVVDINSEVYVKMIINDHRERRYIPYVRQRNVSGLSSDEIELKTATVHVISRPTFDGQISSVMQQAIELCSSMMSMRERREQQDIGGTAPSRVYYHDPNADSTLHTDKNLNAANAHLMMPGVTPYALGDVPRDYTPLNAPIMKGTLEHSSTVLEVTNAFQQGQLERAGKRADGTLPATMNSLRWNSQLGRWTAVREVDPFRPEKLLPRGVRQESVHAIPQVNKAFNVEYDQVHRHLAALFGVPYEWVTGGKIGLSGEVESNMRQFDFAVRDWQEKLETVLASVYLAIYGEEYINKTEDLFAEKAVAKEKHRQIEKAEKRLKEEEERDERQNSKRQRLRLADGETPAFEDNVEGRELLERSLDSDHEDGETGKLYLSREDVERLKAMVNVTVHFTENPVLTQETIDHFLDQKFITRESARDLSFRLAGLPDVYKAEPDELEKDAKLNRKLTELETPVDPEGKPVKPPSKSD